MERNNYSRGGNSGGNFRGGGGGGRSNRGRGFSDSQTGGNGNGRGNGGGGGYYPRGGGNQYYSQHQEQSGGGGGRGSGGVGGGYYPRDGGNGGNRNFPQQQYGNQQAEQYGRGGGGRSGAGAGGGSGRGPYRGGRSAGGGGRDQPSYRTPDYTRQQNVDRVPERSPAGSVDSPSQTQTQRVSGLQIEDLDRTNGFEPIKRPDHGGTLALATVPLLVNHFRVKFDPSKSILRYDIDVKQEGNQEGSSSRTVKKAIAKSDLRMIHEKLCSEYRNEFPLRKTAYDGEKNIYSADTLKAGTYTVELFGRSYLCTVKYGNELNLSKLQDFLNGNALQIPRDVLQALDVVMKANLFREKVSVGRGMYPRVHRREDDLRCGVAAYRGSQQSLKATSNGLVMCTDYSAVPFRKRMPVIDFLMEYVQGIQQVNDIPKVRNKVMWALKGLRVSVTHRRTNQKYIVSGLTDQLTRDISFELEDLEGNNEPQVVMLTDYFREKWGKEIMNLSIPCLKLGNSKKPNYVPMEFCFLAEDKRFPKEQLGREAARRLKDLCLLAPDNRRNEICRLVREEFGTGRHGAEMIENFEVEVGMDMTEVNGRVLAPPRLKLGSLSGKPNIVTVDKVKCHYNFLQGKTFTSGKSADRWALIDFTQGDRRNQLNGGFFILKLRNRCSSIGVQMKEPLLVCPTNMGELSDVNTIRDLLTWVVEECQKKDRGQLQMIVCVMADKHDGYKYLKWVSETEIGVMTQCCLSQNANKANDQFLANLGMKINAKLGGSNVELIEKFPHFSGEDHYMFIGADVNHPAAANKLSPSVAAIVGSMNWPAATKYSARVCPQKHRQEEINNFGKTCLDLVNSYARLNGVKPKYIVVFRDGVSDGQFDMVLNKEMVDLKKVLYTEHYRPFVTFVVAQKRHTTRLFLNNGKDVGNVPPGTVVDTEIVHPVEFDFYLCSHFGGIGTSKSTHYTVIWDEIGFSSDEMQQLIYHLCYIFARCSKPVSLVPPVYYADLVAYRGRMFQEVVMETHSGSETSSFDQFFYNLENHLKDSMFFI